MPKKYLILSCDGGGLRGLLTAYLLEELNRSCDFVKQVDLFAGTSTGGILALGLAGGVAINTLTGLYKTKAEQIFKRSALPVTEAILAAGAAKPVEAFLQKKKIDLNLAGGGAEKLFAVKYASDGLLAALQSIFPTNPLLTGLDRKVLVTTFRLNSPEQGWSPVALHNLAGQGQPPIKSHAVESAMCTAAAPSYFEPYKHSELGYCIDGGIFANNPGSLAVSAAVRAGQDIGNIALLSLGTGGLVARYPFEEMSISAHYLGILPWMWPKASPKHQTPETPLLAALFDGTSACDRIVCEGLLGSRYQRAQVPLPEVIEMDDTSAIDKMEKIATAHVKTGGWKNVVAWAKQQLQD